MVQEYTYYNIIGVNTTATVDEIKKAYRAKALKFHPDKNKHSNEATEQFKQLTAAYEVLSDESKRKIYDHYGSAGLNSMVLHPSGNSASQYQSQNPGQRTTTTTTTTFFQNNNGSSTSTSTSTSTGGSNNHSHGHGHGHGHGHNQHQNHSQRQHQNFGFPGQGPFGSFNSNSNPSDLFSEMLNNVFNSGNNMFGGNNNTSTNGNSNNHFPHPFNSNGNNHHPSQFHSTNNFPFGGFPNQFSPGPSPTYGAPNMPPGVNMNPNANNVHQQQHHRSNNHNRNLRKGHNITHRLNCTLEELFNGKNKKLVLTKQTACSECNATGLNAGVSPNAILCQDCNGLGSYFIQKQMGPMVQQLKGTCPECAGLGVQRVIDENLLCGKCKGKKYVSAKKILSVNIPPGSKNNDSMVFAKEADEGENIIPGDIIILVHELEHDVFVRKNYDLVLKQNIDLLTALAGGSFNFKFLNDKIVKVNLNPGEIIKPGAIKVLKNYGMPKTTPNTYGDLFIQFEVEFPKDGVLTTSSRKALESVLPERNSPSYHNHTKTTYQPRRYSSDKKLKTKTVNGNSNDNSSISEENGKGNGANGGVGGAHSDNNIINNNDTSSSGNSNADANGDVLSNGNDDKEGDIIPEDAIISEEVDLIDVDEEQFQQYRQKKQKMSP